jgi:hypothetical protein
MPDNIAASMRVNLKYELLWAIDVARMVIGLFLWAMTFGAYYLVTQWII